jgi:hypothetical protein
MTLTIVFLVIAVILIVISEFLNEEAFLFIALIFMIAACVTLSPIAISYQLPIHLR